MSLRWFLAVVTGVLVCDAAVMAEVSTDHQKDMRAASSSMQPLSLEALEALVASIAYHPDALIEQILDACGYLTSIHEAATGQATETQRAAWPESVKALLAHPDVLQELNRHPATTARLGLAARTQLADVWIAIDMVRAELDAWLTSQTANEETAETQAVEEPADETSATTGYATGTTASGYPVGYAYPPGYGAFVAGYFTNEVLDEVNAWYATQYTSNSTVAAEGQSTTWNSANGTAAVAGASGSATVTGPQGNSATATGSGVAGAATVGETTYFGAAGAGTVTNSTGTTVTGYGQVHGSATATSTGGSYQTAASGAASSSTGNFASGEHSAQGSYTNNADGSTSFDRSAEGNVNSSAGNTQWEHSGSGTYTGTGSASYSGSTTVDSTHGDASVETTAANGQVSSTVTTGNGQNTYTAGDGQIEHAPQSEASNRSSFQQQGSPFSRQNAQRLRSGTSRGSGFAPTTRNAFSRPGAPGSRQLNSAADPQLLLQGLNGIQPQGATRGALNTGGGTHLRKPPSTGGTRRRSGPPTGGGRGGRRR